MPSPDRQSFAYRAVRPDGTAISGAIDAADAAAAHAELEALQLTQIDVMPSAPLSVAATPTRGKPLGQDDFLAFNQQLMQLAQAGLPIEEGLRLLAAEFGRGKMRQAIDAVTSAMERGQSLPEAIAANHDRFPPLYASLVDAGVRSGNLPGVLLNLGRHMSLVRRLQAALWQTFAYPAVLLVLFFIITYMVLVRLVPEFAPLLRDVQRVTGAFHGINGGQGDGQLPILVGALIGFANIGTAVSPWVIALVALAIVALLVLAGRLLIRRVALSQRLALSLPLVGPILRRSLVARWCDAVGLGIDAGLDLPAAIGLADDAIAWSTLQADGLEIISALESQRPLGNLPLNVLPPLVATSLDAAIHRGRLPHVLELLTQTYGEQAQVRIASVPAVLTPILLALIGCMILVIMLVVVAPIITMLKAITGS